jgi:hypothetical protein
MATITIQLPDWPADRSDADGDAQKKIIDQALQNFVEQIAVYTRMPGFLVAALGAHAAQMQGIAFIGKSPAEFLPILGLQLQHELRLTMEVIDGLRPAIYKPLYDRLQGRVQ